MVHGVFLALRDFHGSICIERRRGDLNKDPEKLESKYINTLWVELKRTGVGLKGLLKNYGVSDAHDLSFEQWKDAMEVLKRKPDIPKPPENFDDDPELPWNKSE